MSIVLKVLISCLPTVAVGLFVGFAFRPEGDEVINRAILLPKNAQVFDLDRDVTSVSLDKFRSLGVSDLAILVDRNNLELTYLGNLPDSTGGIVTYKAGVNVADSSINQTTRGYDIDREKQEITFFLDGNYWDRVTLTLYGLFTLLALIMSLGIGFLFWIYHRTKVDKQRRGQSL